MGIISAEAERSTSHIHIFSIGILILSIAAALHITYSLCFSPYCHIPGPWICKITSLFTTYHDVRLQRTCKIHEWHNKYGPVVLIAPGEVSFSGPSATREIYGATGRHPKSRYFDNFLSYGGERATFNALDYHEHRERRKQSFAFFQVTTIYTPTFIDPVRSRALAFVNQINRDIHVTSTIDLFYRINLYAFDNVTKLLFGSKHSTTTVDTPSCPERSMLEGLKDCEMWNTLLFNVPWAHRLARAVLNRLRSDDHFLSAEENLTEWCTARITSTMRDTRAHQDGSDDHLVKRLNLYRTKMGEPLRTSWVYAEVLDNISAAQATVTVALTYVLWNLAHNSSWQDCIREELSQLPCQDDGFPSFADINAAPVLDACIKESYRLNPLSSGRAERVVPVGKEYDGVFVHPGTIVSTSTVAIQHTPSVFPSPQVYNPGRWLQAGPERLRVMQAHYIPFGYGARRCLGEHFATLEVKLLVAFLLLRYSISEEPAGRTNVETMKQLGTQDALPKGLCCDVLVQPLNDN
ncbi:cytochrome P450 family protein [Dothidotthia symphoricarpi CBS 119687]|uniref:Cytochrome P450 family protein n=1 Tax=Dothidotthia symphoricarpi CBS 119687 TaxID=1392245 RepID=A0A6A6ANG7_9PLEO|nr:cytochrome P450 family protein [Dothidotthia symphoricarpi CBS 119687]KAF2132437.1 cytochrome P450 family protein [Dothidotthia symphoricarpi CBS 119687]